MNMLLAYPWEKIMLAVAVATLLMSGTLIATAPDIIAPAEATVHEMTGEVTSATDPAGASALERMLTEYAALSSEPMLRGIFEPVRPQLVVAAADAGALSGESGVELEVIDIFYKPFPVEYRGVVTYDDRSLVAQINVFKQSYLVSQGMTFSQYTLESLSPESITVKDKWGVSKKIFYRQKAFGDERLARIKDHRSGQEHIISNTSSFLGFTVLDIAEDAVLVSAQGQHLTLEKGKVFK